MIFDSHAHYDSEQFDIDRDELLGSVLPQKGVVAVINMAAAYESLKKTVALCEKYDYIYGAVGIHPECANDLPDNWLSDVEALLSHPKIVAVGEIVDKKITPQKLADGMRADGLGTVLGGVFNTFPYTAFAQNVGLVAITGVRTRHVATCAGAILVIFGLLPKMGAIVEGIPAGLRLDAAGIDADLARALGQALSFLESCGVSL